MIAHQSSLNCVHEMLYLSRLTYAVVKVLLKLNSCPLSRTTTEFSISATIQKTIALVGMR